MADLLITSASSLAVPLVLESCCPPHFSMLRFLLGSGAQPLLMGLLLMLLNVKHLLSSSAMVDSLPSASETPAAYTASSHHANHKN